MHHFLYQLIKLFRSFSVWVRSFIKNMAMSMGVFVLQATFIMLGALIALAIFSLIALPIAGLYFEGENSMIIIGLLSILIAGPLLWFLHSSSKNPLAAEVDLYNHISVPYEKLLMTANGIAHFKENDRKKLVEKEREVTAKSYIEAETKPLLKSAHFFNALPHSLIHIAMISLCSFVFSTGLVYLVSAYGDASFSYVQAGTFVINSMVKGALFDFFEAYDIELLNVVPYSLLYRHLDFVIRMVVSIFVIGGIAQLTRVFYRSILFNRKIKNQRSRADFLNGLRDHIAWKIDRTRTKVYDEVDKRRELLDDIMLPILAEELGLKIIRSDEPQFRKFLKFL